MSKDHRVDRLEEKVDGIKEDINEIKVELTDLKADIKYLIPKLDEHVAGDVKIINSLVPVLDKLPAIVEIAEEHQFDKKLREKRTKRIKYISTRLGLVSLLVGIAASVFKII